ncbi:glycosyltransferase [Pseudoalteromonas sp. NSLLW218]|uniref:glycosyltransferase n=1 Tax=Pseudoalteromonas sp. NSLLW218 TaxID=2792048 RepID=UPI0018CF3D56|nr:glycosyltransferase [Pseudoalteromonas sp. NSLLW218]MBH0087501.1 glycosyltransferase [Pseudoalteromonas sp. NSLLW218]
MKIIQVITGLGMGGAERVVADLSAELIDMGHEVIIIYLYGDVKISIDKRIQLVKIDIKRPVRAFISFLKIVSKYNPDIIHGHMFHANMLTRAMKLFLSSKIVINTAHSGNEGGRFRMALYRLTNSQAKLFTNVSVGAVKEFERKKAVPANLMLPIPNGINVDNFSFSSSSREKIRKLENIADDELLILSVGSLREAKGFDCAIKAADMLCKNNKLKFTWIIIGEGPLSTQLENLIAKLNVEGKVKLVGTRSNIQEYFSAADIFVSSSYWEGFGLVIAEAMAASIPVVSTNTSGALQVIPSDEYICEVGDFLSIAKLVIDVVDRMQDEVGFRQYLENNKSVIEHDFSIQNYSKKWSKLYSEVND